MLFSLVYRFCGWADTRRSITTLASRKLHQPNWKQERTVKQREVKNIESDPSQQSKEANYISPTPGYSQSQCQRGDKHGEHHESVLNCHIEKRVRMSNPI